MSVAVLYMDAKKVPDLHLPEGYTELATQTYNKQYRVLFALNSTKDAVLVQVKCPDGGFLDFHLNTDEFNSVTELFSAAFQKIQEDLVRIAVYHRVLLKKGGSYVEH
jgi:hypothetical protein